MDPMDQVKEMLARKSECIAAGDCVNCGGAAEEFDDDLSRKEYQISGYCQACQDYAFDVLFGNE